MFNTFKMEQGRRDQAGEHYDSSAASPDSCMDKAFLAFRDNRRSIALASGFMMIVALVEKCMYPSYMLRHPSINSPLITLFLLFGGVGLLLSLVLYSDNLNACFLKYHVQYGQYMAPGGDEEAPPPYPGRGQPGDVHRERTYDTVPL